MPPVRLRLVRARRGPVARAARWLLSGIAVVVAVVLVRAFVAEPFTVPSGSMEPTLMPGERIVAAKWSGGGSIGRGDIVVFDGATTFGPAGPAPGPLERAFAALAGHSADSVYVKRVIAVGGQRVACCDAAGRVTVDGVGVDEPYVAPGDAPSRTRFDAIVPPGRLWLMGDRRDHSKDSRSHIVSPGGGTVSVEDVIGPVVFRYWPMDRLGAVPQASAGRP